MAIWNRAEEVHSDGGENFEMTIGDKSNCIGRVGAALKHWLVGEGD